MAVLKKILPIGEILLSKGVISKAQLEEALRIGKNTNTRAGKVMVSLGYATDDDIAHALADQYRIPFFNLKDVILDQKTVKIVPEAIARRYLVIALSLEGEVLNVAMADPLNVFAVDEIKRATKHQVKPHVCTEKDVVTAIDQYYSAEASLEEMIRKTQKGTELLKGEEDIPEKLEKIAGDTSVIQLVNQIIQRAVMDNASDIHVEADEDVLRVRLRIDGVLHETMSVPMKLHAAVLSRIKILGELDIAEKRLPQDGRCVIKVANRDIDFRISTLPTIFGEKAVLRILDKAAMVLELERLTPVADSLDVLNRVIKRPFGMILLTGPTGSGKTTTAYTLINLLNVPGKNLVTVEDPVEYHFKRVNQVQVNPKVGITFASALRHILRQDPDTILIGEIRDKETAEIAIHAALTGHLVISTIHTNDAVGTISRLLDMGIEPFLVASSVICIVGQRLIRKICDACKTSYPADPKLLEDLGVKISGDKAVNFYKGKGCPVCKGSGLKGRIGLYEVLVLDDEIKAMILAKANANNILDAAKKKGFNSLRVQGIKACLGGYTSVEEVLQATQDVE